MAAPALPDFDQLMLRLVQLEHLERETERRLIKAQDRNSAFPNEVSGRLVATLTTEQHELRTEMDSIRAQLVPIMRTPSR
jgi:signal transduction histidine kinase